MIMVVVDERKCVGAGQCVWVAPTVFDQRSTDGIVVLLAPNPGPDEIQAVREAADLCPSHAIQINEN